MCFTEYSVILLYNGCKVQTILFLFNLASWLLATVKLTSPPPTLTSQHTDTEEHTCVSVIQDEFYRITMVHLESKFMSKLDEFTPQLLKLFHTKGGSMGLQLQAILLKTPSNPNIHMKREIVIRCSMKFLGESSEQLLREYDDADEDRILQDLALQTLKIYIKPNPSEAPDIGMWTMTSKVKQTSALRLASSFGHVACVEELLFRGAEVNADPGGGTALHDACAGGHAACVKMLLDHGADVQLLSADGNAPLHLCTSPLSLQCAELLLDGGADVNMRTAESRLTPLHVAALRGLEGHVELLLSLGADVLATNREGETALNAACARADRPLETGRYLGVVRRLLDAGANPRTVGKKRHTPLHNACANCCPAIVELLLQYGAQADVSNCAGCTPMECVLQVLEDYLDQQPEKVVRTLLNHGAKPVPPKMLRQCVLSPATFEVILNSYTHVPSFTWMDDCPHRQEHSSFYELVRKLSDQPRSLQHLCRCTVRHRLGVLCQSQVRRLDVPSSVKDYLLLQNDGTLH
ncbi:ankyrin repeat and SOCS box protein 16 isoform X1 [Corythoichthys intestinalis]|uniref:ankyrin repeat and SOCS box protein 16 isoform X1 n=1 Tax=Corythoichthys intestinalis TaxID=161448 RepID=UPI0025A5B4A8|nr:ankyrin repeat and SOCS box protein 16 isoform X1 [Corythoichthys intestinalis]